VPSGGRREGAGRKPNALTKLTREIAERASTEGKTPLEVMLDNMRHFQQVALDAEATIANLTAEELSGRKLEPAEQFKMLLADVKKAAGLRQMAHECARDAAPFMHARLAAVEHSGKDGGPIEFLAKLLSEIDGSTRSLPRTEGQAQ
jgi:hypothetical protein